MKTCKNCSTANEVKAVRCVACNMENNFSLHAAMPIDPKPAPEPELLQCINCGNHESAEVSHCTQCKFPLALVTPKPISKIASINRKVG